MNFRKVSVSLDQGSSQWWPESWEKSGRDKKLANCVTLEDTRVLGMDSLDTFYSLSGLRSEQNKPRTGGAKKQPQ